MQGPHLPPKKAQILKVHSINQSLQEVDLAKIVKWVKDEILWTLIEALLTGLANVESAFELLF